MPNPFPGMNPFLEKPSLWPSFHQRFITYLADAIDPLLPENHSADLGVRVYTSAPSNGMYPDVFVAKHAQKKKGRNGTTAILEADPPLEVEYWAEEIREPFIKIRMGPDPGKLIAVIELLSPANKTPGKGRTLYLRKQARVLRSTTHLMEIDFLRAGEHTVAVQLDTLPENHWDYLVCLHRGRSRSKFECWPIPLQDRLPRIHVPLSKKDTDVVVDLQTVLDRCCETATGRRIDYSQECPPPLSKKNAKWIDELLRKKKLRK
ncbi:MAG: DUF4058 family protein [Planctomycetes bacterium]|nr:DUF4058 family protein [Planctomycetota bacterium]